MVTGLEANIEKRVDRISDRLLRWRWIAGSAVGFAACNFWLGHADGWEYLPAAGGWLFFAGATASTAWARDRKVRKEKESAVTVAKRMWTTLNGAGLPIIDSLGAVCRRSHRSGAYDPMTALLVHVLDSTRLRLGDDASANRAAYYEKTDKDTLTLVKYAGGDRPPRHSMWRRSDPAGQFKLAFLDGANGPFEDVPDVTKANIPGFVIADAGYTSYLTTHVRVGQEVFGLLCVDSPVAGNFTERDKVALSLLSGLLAAGIAAEREPATAGTVETDDTPTG